MSKPALWHEQKLDGDVCWIFHKYRLILHDTLLKLRRDVVFLKKYEELLQNPEHRQQQIAIPSVTKKDASSRVVTCEWAVPEEMSVDEQVSTTTAPMKKAETGPKWKFPEEMKIPRLIERMNAIIEELDHMELLINQLPELIRVPLLFLVDYQAHSMTAINEAHVASVANNHMEYLTFLATLLLPFTAITVFDLLYTFG